MSPKQLLAYFDRIAEAPGAVPRLRRFILDLAVRGKLVEQDSGDEPAIGDHSCGGVGSHKGPTGSVRHKADDERPFRIPHQWRWALLGDLAALENGDRSQSYPSRDEFVEAGIPFINAGHLQNGRVSLERMNYISPQTFDRLKSGKIKTGDILYCLRGSLGKTAIVNELEKGAIASSLVILRFAASINRRFLLLYFMSSIAAAMVNRFDNGTAQPNLSSADLRRFLVPVAPLAEQHRIVAKVDELMALCDRLEAAQAERERRRQIAATAALSNLEASESQARLALSVFPTILKSERQLKAFRDEAYDLAFRGRLVTGDPSDKAAARFAKARSGRATQSKGRSNRTKSCDFEPPFAVPPHWQWTRFGAVIAASDAGWSPQTESFARHEHNWGVLKVSAVSWDEFRPEDNKQLLPGVVPPERAQVRTGDFLISRANTSKLVAKAVVVEQCPDKLILSDKIVRLRITEECNKRYLCMLNNHAKYARVYYAEKASGTSLSMKNISRQVIYDLPIPLPPRAEQDCIVAKLDQVMAVGDRLEAQLATAQTDSSRLLEAVLNKALADASQEPVDPRANEAVSHA